MPHSKNYSDVSVLAAKAAIRVADVASSWTGNVMRFEATRKEGEFLVHVESDDGSLIRASIPDTWQNGDYNDLLITLDINCDQVSARNVRCTLASFDRLIERSPVPFWAQFSTPLTGDLDEVEWDEDSTTIQPRSELCELVISL